MGLFKVKKNFGWKMSTTFCGSPLIGMSPPSRPSLRTHMMTLVPDYAIKKLKLFLIPEAEHCGLNYYGFLSMTVTGAKYTLFLIVLLKIHTLSGSISWIVHLWECLPPPPGVVPRSDLHISLAGCCPLLGSKSVQLRSVKDSCF